jgi:hypothetical protein
MAQGKLQHPAETASHYMHLAVHREVIEAKSATVTDLTVNAALRLLKPKKVEKDKGAKQNKAGSIFDLSSRTWADAPDLARASFVNTVGLQAFYQAASPSLQQEFRDWLLQQERLPVAQHVQSEIPADLSIPDCLKRGEAAGHA